jgi:hypothetical protein
MTDTSWLKRNPAHVNIKSTLVNLGQKHSQAAKGRFMGDQNLTHFSPHKLCGNWKKLIVVPSIDWKKFGCQKVRWLNFLVTKPCDPQKIWSPILWRSKKLGRNLIVAVYWMVIKFFQLPKNGACRTFFESLCWGLSKNDMHQANLLWQPKHFSCHNYHKGGNQFFYVAIQHILVVEWWLKFFNRLRRDGGDDFFCQNWYYHD